MKKTFFKILIFTAIAFAFSAKISCDEIQKNFFEFMLPNGMSVFVFEDFSTPLVHAEFCAKAGYEIRNESDAPFFLLCAELFGEAGIDSNNAQGFDFPLESECTANGARFSIDCTGAELKKAFERIEACAFAPLFSDEALQRNFEKIKGQEISSAENFINSQINSRVFENFSRQGVGAPYPLFSEQKNLSELRAIVNRIFREYYAPQNCAIFVSGAIKAKSVFHLAQETFGKHAGKPHAAEKSFLLAKENPESEASENSNANFLRQRKKFVLCDKEFSSDFVQVVAQFSPLEKNKAKIAAAIFEAKNSSLKNSLIQNSALAIRGSDYVNSAAATKRNLSRMVLQTIFEKSENSVFGQIEIFEKIIDEEICGFSESEFDAAKKNLCQNFCDSISNPKLFMENFLRFWTDEISEGKIQGGSYVEQFLSIPEKIAAENFADLKSALQKNEPWIFILLNEKILSPLKSEFENSGYEIIAKKEQSAQEQNTEKIAIFSKRENSLQTEIPIYNANFVSQSLASEKNFFLSNKIRVALKENESSKKTAVALYVFGGEAFDADANYGMQSIIADILEMNISDSLEQKISLGEISQSAKAKASVSNTEFLVTIECDSNEEKVALQCIGEGLLLKDFAPSRVDLALNARRARQILCAGSPAWQMYSAGARQFYKSAIYRSLYSSRKEILENIKYSDALEAYQKLLDASRIEIIAAGNFCEDSEKEFVEECEVVFGGLKESKFKRKILSDSNKVSKASLAVKLEHTFLTDISADKADSRPAVLVPTTEFYDPVQFWIRSPKVFEEDAAIFDALILELEAQCKRIAAQNFAGIEARLEERSALVSFGAITFFNVKKISDAEFILKESLEQIHEKLFSNSNKPSGDNEASLKADFFNGMKARWIKARYSESHENSEAILRLAREASIARLSEGERQKAGMSFAREYETVALCEDEQFREIWKKYFENPPFKLYSLDSKK